MKNLFLVFLLFTINSFAEVCLQGRVSKWDATGTFVGPYESCHISVKVGYAATVSKGQVVISDTTQTNPHVVTISSTAGSVPLCIMMKDCATGKVCNCQTYGYADYALFDVTNTGASVGHSVYIGETTAGTVQAEGKSSIAGSDIPIGSFLETKSSTGTVKLFLKLR